MVEKKAAVKQKKSFAIGIDMGATTIKAGIVDPKGAIVDHVTVDTKAEKGPVAVIRQLNFSIQELLGRVRVTECRGIGLGSPGVVNVEEGSVHYPPNFADWTDVKLADALRRSTPLPVIIENDANCAAIAESKYGAGLRYNDFLFVIWGTGVGGGVILGKKIYRGPHGGAGEVGHVSIDYNGPVCNCGNRGCIESYIGQRYLSQRTREILERDEKNDLPSKIVDLVGGDLSKIEPAIISEAAEDGDPTAIEILEEAGQLLGYALASILNVLDLRVVVIGGGISAVPRFVFKTIENSLRSRVLKPHKNGIRVVRAELGNEAGMIGAASLVM